MTSRTNTFQHIESYFFRRSLELADGNVVAYREVQPEGGNQVFVIIHGLTGTSYSMLLLADAYRKKNFQTIVIDLPGHGGSTPIPVDDMSSLARWLHDVLQEVCPKHQPTLLLGDSFGASVVLAYAQRYTLPPTTSIILAAPIPLIHPVLSIVDRLFSRVPDAIARQIYYTNRFLLSIRIRFLLAQWRRTDYRQYVAECIAVEGAQANHRYAEMILMPANIRSNPFLSPLSKQLASQTVIMYGDADRVAGSRAAQYLQKWGYSAHIVQVPQCGHLIHIEGISDIIDASVSKQDH